jgi:hypothetical protein
MVNFLLTSAGIFLVVIIGVTIVLIEIFLDFFYSDDD